MGGPLRRMLWAKVETVGTKPSAMETNSGGPYQLGDENGRTGSQSQYAAERDARGGGSGLDRLERQGRVLAGALAGVVVHGVKKILKFWNSHLLHLHPEAKFLFPSLRWLFRWL